jgi:signal transduction histidine kinase
MGRPGQHAIGRGSFKAASRRQALRTYDPGLVSAGVDVAWLTAFARTLGADRVETGVRWVTHSVESEFLATEIRDAVTRMSRLVEATKQYSQLDRAPQQSLDVHVLLDASLAMLAGSIPPGIEVVRDYVPDSPRLLVFGAELNQVWTNIVQNAVEAMGTHGTLTVRTWTEGADRLLVSFTDTGAGIVPSDQPRIFEPFFTTKGVGQGTGLGLDIAFRVVVVRHHGDIQVESQPGQTRFTVCLPVTTTGG